ncbi:MAG: glycosyltransferase [Alphaproteobacteria bacterium]|nr:glycosyltransferase [Alphaproteobacteria bacterium]
MNLDISVTLPTYNRAAFLEKCLEGLCAQTLSPVRYEICVVANACTDATPDIVAQVAARHPRHRLFMVEESVPGLSRARNCGLKHTTAPLVANVDDDGTVYPDWLERFLARFAEFGDDLAIVSGEVEPVWAIPKPDWLTPRMQCFLSAGTGLGNEARFLGVEESSAEGNGCCRRDMLAAVGNLPVELGRVGNNLLSGENVFEKRIHQLGGRVFFDPAIILRHYIHADRLTPLWFRKRFFWQGVSGMAVRNYQQKNGIPVDSEIMLNLPLEAEDWAFVGKDTPDGLEKSLHYFQSLGFVLALTGLLPIDGAQ